MKKGVFLAMVFCIMAGGFFAAASATDVCGRMSPDGKYFITEDDQWFQAVSSENSKSVTLYCCYYGDIQNSVALLDRDTCKKQRNGRQGQRATRVEDCPQP